MEGDSRPHDRELGIAGGELIVMDLQTQEVLGLRRGFIRSGGVRNNATGIWWLSGQVCPTLRPDKRSQKDGDFTYWFVSKILQPAGMEVRMSSDIRSWLDYAIQQMAAESYLDGINLLSRNEVKDKLLLGNNNPVLDSSLSGKTRFTNVLAEEFLDRYQIIDHHANDASGFSATLFKDTSNNTYTLSFRSTEYADSALGGD